MLIENLAAAISDIHLTEAQAAQYKKSYEELLPKAASLEKQIIDLYAVIKAKNKTLSEIEHFAKEGLEAILIPDSFTKAGLTSTINFCQENFNKILDAETKAVEASKKV